MLRSGRAKAGQVTGKEVRDYAPGGRSRKPAPQEVVTLGIHFPVAVPLFAGSHTLGDA